MRILRVAWWKRPYRGGGLIEYVEDIMEEMVKRGHQEVYFFSGSYDLKLKPYIKEYKESGIQYYELINSPNIAPQRMGKPQDECQQKEIEELFEKVLLKEHPNIVHIHEFEGLTAGVIDIAKKYGIPIAFSIHNYWPLCPQVELFDYVGNLICDDYQNGERCVRCEIYSPHKTTGLTKWIRRAEKFKKHQLIYDSMKVAYKMVKNIFRNFRTHYDVKNDDAGERAKMYVKRRECFVEKLNKEVDKILAISSIAKKIYVMHDVDEKKIEVIYRGLRKLDSIKPKPYRNNDYPIVYGFLGGSSPHKGIDVLINAFLMLEQKVTKLVIYGGKDQEYIKKIKNLGISNIEFRGKYRPEELNKVLKEIDVGVVPSVWYEAFGLVGLEFLQARVPLIVSDTCGVAEIVEDGKTGYIFKSGDISALFGKMKMFVENPFLIREYQKNIKRFKTIEEHADEMEEIYENLVKK